MSKFVVHIGWKLKPKSSAFILYIEDEKSGKERVYDLTPGNYLNIRVSEPKKKYCVGFSSTNGEHIPCPTGELIESNRMQCQSCSFNEFYLCRAICQGDFCHPSSNDAKEHCWKTTACVYLTHIAGKIKVGSSTNPLRRWLGQGSDAGICVAEGVGLAPRALEHQIGLKLSLPLAVRITQKMKFLGKSIGRGKINEELQAAIDEIYESMKSEILLPKEKLEEITYLDSYHGTIPEINARPIVKKIADDSFELSGEIIGVKGTILVLRNGATYYTTNLSSIIGLYVDISEEKSEMKGQKSLFDFV
ncbi:MAG: DUF2797 domain-containing protein [Candidatus Heimdallarchaeota archaeon]